MKKAIVLLTILVVLVLFLGIFTFLPKTSMGAYTYVSPLGIITKSQDIGDNTTIRYNITKPADMSDADFQIALDKAFNTMQDRLSYYTKEIEFSFGKDYLSLIMPKSTYPEEMLRAITTNGEFLITTAENKADAIITDRSHFNDVRIEKSTTQANTLNFIIELDNTAVAALAEATKNAPTTAVNLYFVIDGTTEYSTQTKAILNRTTLTLNPESVIEAQMLYTILKTDTYGFEMSQAFVEQATPIAGLNNSYYLITLAIVVLAIVIAFVVNYGVIGWASVLGLLVNIMATIWVSAFISMKQLSLAGILASIVGIAFYALFNAVLLEKFRYNVNNVIEKKQGRKLEIAVIKSFNNIQKPLLITAGVLLSISIVFWAVTSDVIMSFGNVLAYFTIFGTLSTLFVTRMFANLIIKINQSPKCYRISKENK